MTENEKIVQTMVEAYLSQFGDAILNDIVDFRVVTISRYPVCVNIDIPKLAELVNLARDNIRSRNIEEPLLTKFLDELDGTTFAQTVSQDFVDFLAKRAGQRRFRFPEDDREKSVDNAAAVRKAGGRNKSTEEKKMTVNESDWKLFRKRLPEWQEAHMKLLIKQYIALLTRPRKASENFWELEERIQEDKKVFNVTMSRTYMDTNIIAMLTSGMITLDDLDGFSEELQEKMAYVVSHYPE